MKKHNLVFFLLFLLSCTPPSEQTIDTLQQGYSLLMLPSSTCKDISLTGIQSTSLANTHILYRGVRENSGIQIRVLSINDGGQVLLNNYPPASGTIGFLRDGRQFLITDYHNIWLGNIDGSSPTKVETVNLKDDLLKSFRPYSSTWSNVLKIGNRQPPQDLFDYTKGRFHSPDNSVIALWKRGDKALVFINNATQQEIAIVTTGPQDTISGIWSADSKWFIFSHTYGIPTKYYSQLFKVNADGTIIRPLTDKDEGLSFENPSISPDENKVVFSISKGIEQSIGIVNLEGNQFYIYQPKLNGAWFLFSTSIVWSPDSQWISFKIEYDLRENIFIVNIVTGETYCVLNGYPLKDILMDWR